MLVLRYITRQPRSGRGCGEPMASTRISARGEVPWLVTARRKVSVWAGSMLSWMDAGETVMPAVGAGGAVPIPLTRARADPAGGVA